jgi:multidomain signaling protein FimX
VQRLRDALAGDEFVLHYQPVISLQGEPGAMYEALLRLQAGEDETISPATFLPVAEEHGLLAEIDRWVVGRAVRTLAERERAGKPVTLLAKVSQASLGDDALVRHLRALLAEHGVPGERLVLEVSESKVFTHLQATQAFGAGVSALGCRLALEQFGAGLDSFQLLSHLSPHYVKLDRSFTQELTASPDNQKRVRDVAQRARNAGCRTMAERVEDASAMTVLFSAGIDYVEGYFLAPPGPGMNYEFEG